MHVKLGLLALLLVMLIWLPNVNRCPVRMLNSQVCANDSHWPRGVGEQQVGEDIGRHLIGYGDIDSPVQVVDEFRLNAPLVLLRQLRHFRRRLKLD